MAFTLRITGGKEAGSRERLFTQQEVLVGRDGAADLRLDAEAISLVHLALRQAGGRLLAEDRGSTNGSRLDGERLVAGEARPLAVGSVLTIGPFALEVLGLDNQKPSTVDRRPSTSGPRRQLLAAFMALIAAGAMGGIIYLLLT